MPKTGDDYDGDSIVSNFTLNEEISHYVQTETIRLHAEARRSSSLDVYPGIAPLHYDFAAERQNPIPNNLIESTAHLIKGGLGAGVLGMHEAFMVGGIWTSLAGSFLIGLLVPLTMLMLVKSAQTMYVRIRVPRMSYADLVEAAVATGPFKQIRRYSKLLRYAVDTCLFIEMCGTCCVFQIMIARTLKQAIEGFSTEIQASNLNLRWYIAVTGGPLLFLSLIRSLKLLAPVVLVADLFMIFCVCVTLFYGVSTAPNITARASWKDVHGLFRFFGVCLYSIQGVMMALPVENNMKSPHHFNTVVAFGMPTVVAASAIVGFFGYWSIGDVCRTPITLHIPFPQKTIIIVGQLLIAIMLLLTCGLHAWMPSRIVWHYIGRMHRRRRWFWLRFYRALQVLLITGVAAIFPRANHMMTFLGAVFCSLNGLIFPPLIESLVTWRDDKALKIRWRSFKNFLLVMFGFIVLTGGTIASFGVTPAIVK